MTWDETPPDEARVVWLRDPWRTMDYVPVDRRGRIVAGEGPHGVPRFCRGRLHRAPTRTHGAPSDLARVPASGHVWLKPYDRYFEPHGHICRVIEPALKPSTPRAWPGAAMSARLAAAMKRARTDPIARLLAAATAAGVRFRISGATLQVAGADALHPDDRSCLRRYLPDIRRRIEPPAPEVDLLDLLDVDVEVITDAGRAGEVLASLRGRGALGFDIETAPRERNGGPPWAQITKAGRLAVHQPKQQGDAGLDPIRAAPRLAQIYDPGAATVYVFDFKHVPVDAARGARGRAPARRTTPPSSTRSSRRRAYGCARRGARS